MMEYNQYDNELDVEYAMSYTTGAENPVPLSIEDMLRTIDYGIARSEYLDSLQERIALCERRLAALEGQCGAKDKEQRELLSKLKEWFNLDVSDLI